MIKYCSLLFSLLCLSGGIRAQRTEIYAPHIQTVQVVANNDINAPAVITLDSNDYIELSFDELSHEYHRYQYVLSHCNTTAAKLTKGQCALIAATLPTPIRFDSAHPSPYILKRQKQIMRLMNLVPKFPPPTTHH